MQQAKSTRPFATAGSGRDYAERRYRGFFQRLVARREQALANRLLDRSADACNGHIVDLPCGYGRFYPLLKRHGLQVSAMDQSHSMVEIYRDRGGFSEQDHAERADVLQPLPAAAAAAGRALCIRLFQHLHHPELRVQALRTLGANGRQIVMTYYDAGNLHYWSKHALMRLKRKPVRVKMINRRQFDREVAEAGLRIVERIPLLRGIHAQTWVLLAPAASR